MRKISTCVAATAFLAMPAIVLSQEPAGPSRLVTRDTVSANVPATPKNAPSEPTPRNWFGSEARFTTWTNLTGDWAGLRTKLTDHGVEIGATYTYDATSNVSGGAKRGSALRSLFMGQMSADLSTLVHLHGGTAFVSWGRASGANGSDFAGDIQAFSNIDADPFNHLYEAWVEQTALDGKLRIKVGRVDANTEFAVVAPAGDFINASAGFSPTILGLPTYPDPKLSANMFVQPASWLSVSGGAYAGTFDAAIDGTQTVTDRFTLGQLTTSWGHAGRFGAGAIAIGRWHHSGMAERFDGGLSRGADGWWTSVEQRLIGDDATDEQPASGVRVFAKYGSAPAMLSVFQHHLMAGVVLDGGLRSGSEDAIGVAMTHVDLSNVPDAETPLNETSFELYYKIKVFGFTTIRPNVQYIVHPSGDPARRNALAATLRTSISF